MKTVTLKPHQEEAVKKLDNGKILVGDVGSGKTYAAIAYYLANESPRDIVVITTAKKRDELDWEKEFIKMGVWKTEDSTLHGKLTVDSWNNIGKYTDVKQAFFIFDEQRLVGSGAWAKAFYKIAKSNRWILLSATPGDTWLDYIPVFIANGFYKSKTEFLRRHVVFVPFVKHPKVQRYLEPGVLVRRRNSIQVHMPYERHTTRHIHNIEVAYDQELVRKVMVDRWNIFDDKPMRDIADLFRVTRKIVNSDPSRLNAVRSLLEKHDRVIVFYNFDYELQLLRTLSEPGCKTSTTDDSEVFKDSGSISEALTGSLTLRNSSLDNQPQPSTSTSTYDFVCDECNPDGYEPCDPIIHGTEPEWTREKLSSLVNSSSPRLSMPIHATVESSIAGSTASTALSPCQPSSTRMMEIGSQVLSGLREGLENELKHRSGTTSTTSETPGTTTTPVRSTRSSTKMEDSIGRLSESSGNDSTSAQRIRNQSGSSGPGQPKEPRSPLVIAEWNGHKHQPVPTTDRWVYLVQYSAGSEGWNCITTDAMIFYSLTYSYKHWHQAHGRIDRLNTLYFDLHYYVLQSSSWIDQAIRRSLNAKKSFNEASWGRKK